jgi:hypothetical protein
VEVLRGIAANLSAKEIATADSVHPLSLAFQNWAGSSSFNRGVNRRCVQPRLIGRAIPNGEVCFDPKQISPRRCYSQTTPFYKLNIAAVTYCFDHQAQKLCLEELDTSLVTRASD